jgi:hypothetical protein
MTRFHGWAAGWTLTASYRLCPPLTAPSSRPFPSLLPLPSPVSRLPSPVSRSYARYIDLSAPILPAMLMALLHRAVHSAQEPQAERL